VWELDTQPGASLVLLWLHAVLFNARQ